MSATFFVPDLALVRDRDAIRGQDVERAAICVGVRIVHALDQWLSRSP